MGIVRRDFVGVHVTSVTFSQLLKKVFRKLWQVIVACAIGLFLCPGVSAQVYSNAGMTADPSNPLGPSGPNKSNDVWAVDPKTGSVHINIPISTVPSGGRGPRVQPVFQYNSSSTLIMPAPNPVTTGADLNGTPFTYFVYSWSGPESGLPNTAAPVGPWTYTDGPSLFATWAPIYATVPIDGDGSTSSSGTPTQCRQVAPILFADSDGQIHDLQLAVTYMFDYEEQPTCPGGAGPVTSAGTSDGSDTLSSISGYNKGDIANPGAGTPGTLNTVLLSDGTQVIPAKSDLSALPYSSTASLEDANGNMYTASGKDSEGRSIVSSSLPVGSSDIPVGTSTIVTASGVNISETYTITASSQSFGGNFVMPHPNVNEVTANSYGSSPNVVSSTPGEFSAIEITSIQFPDTTSYQFTYDPTYGMISTITFPSGGHVRFQWGVRGRGTASGAILSASTVVATDVFLSDSTGNTDEKHWHYVYQDEEMSSNLMVPGALVTQETQPDGSRIVYTSMPFAYGNDYAGTTTFTPQETLRQVSDAAGNPVMTTATLYTPNSLQLAVAVYPAQVATAYFGSGAPIQKQTQYTYDSAFHITETDDSGFYSCTAPCTTAPTTPPGGWLRKTLTNYLWSTPNSAQPTFPKSYQQANILGKPSQITITDGSGNIFAQTQYNYDEFALSGSMGILNHDDVNFPAAKVGPRGNLTTERHCIAFSGSTCSSWISKTTTYDLTGMPTSVSDFNGNLTSYIYTDAYVTGGPSIQTNAYPTQVTTVSSPHIEYFTYNYYSGSTASRTDWNGKTTNYGYNDPLNRLKLIGYPQTTDGTTGQTGSGSVAYRYTDSVSGWSVQKTVVDSAGNSTVSTVLYDGLGRIMQIQSNSDPAGIDYVDTKYNAMGQVYSVSNPYRSTSDSTYGLTVFPLYDALGRKKSQTDSDGTSTQSWTYSGNTVTFTDENGNSWQRTSDALGRLTSVVEPGGINTSYSYDPLDNLKCADQWGTGTVGAACSSGRVRQFLYDPLSRLTNSTNPETGLVKYSYVNTSGALCSGDSSAVCSKTDTRGITTSYSYDTLNRLLSKTFVNDPSVTASSCYQYDRSSVSGASGNLVGRLTNAWTQKGTCSSAPLLNSAATLTRRSMMSYDAMGRLLSEQQCTFANCKAATAPYQPCYDYDLSGNVIHHSNGIGTLLFANSYNAASQLSGVNAVTPSTCGSSSYAAGTALFSSPTYSPHGGLSTATYGTGLSLVRSYDSRLRVTDETDTGNASTNPTPGTAKITITGTDRTQ